MLRIQSESILRPAPIFETLGKTSVLADSVIDAAYEIAVREAPPPAGLVYEPRDQMMVIALGRLGMREFDLGSDADLVFVIPDADAAEAGLLDRRGRTHGGQTISSYTGEGVMFAVDTRLRPNGREGDLVQTEGAYKAYFAAHAEAWEGITYMKSRAVAGNVERATAFCTSCRKWIGGATGRACVRARSWPRCARGWNANRGRAIRSRPARAAITISISR